MTHKEAIEQLKMDRDLCNFNPMTGEEEPMNEDCRKSAMALDIAIKALEPKKGHWITKPHIYGVAFCSECNFELRIDDTKYCPNCGAEMEK